jgi:hypothetical protein
VILAGGPTLQQHATTVVGYEDRKRAVEYTARVRAKLFLRAELTIALVDENDSFFNGMACVQWHEVPELER